MKNDIKLPKDLSPLNKPRVYFAEPQSEIFTEKIIDTHDIQYADYPLEVDEKGNGVYIRVELDYDGCYYESDHPTFKFFKLRKQLVPNPNYKRELKIYEKHCEEIQEKVKNWEKWKKVYDEDQEKRKLKQEKREFLRLSKKFAKNSENNSNG